MSRPIRVTCIVFFPCGAVSEFRFITLISQGGVHIIDFIALFNSYVITEISGSDILLKLSVAIDENLRALRPQLQAHQLPRDPRGRVPTLSAKEVLTILVWGA